MGDSMAARKRGNPLERWEIATVKAMLDRGGYSDQVILAYFTRPTRSVNHRVISEIRNGVKHKSIKPATSDGLDDFLATWPDVDPESGLSTQGDELLIKAREAMIAAVHVFNGAGLTFRTELFIVTAMIAWTYLLHNWFGREGIDFRYTNSDGTIKKTKQGEDCYWDLAMLFAPRKLSDTAWRDPEPRIPDSIAPRDRASLHQSHRRRRQFEAAGMLHKL
jgi:hypothetical protein